LANEKKGKHIIISNIEHNSVIRSVRRLNSMGYKATSLSLNEQGRVNPQDVAEAITDETILVSIMHSNNETGTIQPIEEIGKITREKKVIFHTDAVDSVGVVPIDVQKLGVDLLSFASNTFYGPTGVGGLYIRRGTRVFPILDGGVQEQNKRAGAENLIGIIGMGKAAGFAGQDMDKNLTHLKGLKDRFLKQLPDYIDEYIINTHPDYSLPNLVSLSVKYIEGESVMLMLDDENIAVSTRSACATGSLRASHVLMSLGLNHADAQGTLVVSFGIDNTKEDVDRFLAALKNVVTTLRDISPLYNKISKTK
ncbi:MAG: cysteine desulfurase, partial [Deltaproteobacteria bacterium]|nr:cysteine desulfurase [Deltaproteobacteria bacterium]